MESSTQAHYTREPATMALGGAVGDDRWGKPSLSELQAQLDEAVAIQEAGLKQNDLRDFYQFLRSTDLSSRAPGFPHVCCRILHRLGGVSPAVALAFENHLYVVSSLVTFPLEDPAEEARRQLLMQRLREQRLLVANTSSVVHGGKLGTYGVSARRTGDGFWVDGSAAYVSLSTQSDLLLFKAPIEQEGPGLFILSLRDTPGVEIGPFLFPRTMLDSDTRRVYFKEVFLPSEALLLSGQTEQILRMHHYETIWHQLLTTSLYLGAAARALDEARLFLRSVHGKDDRPLAELDGMATDVGRLVIRYRGAWALVLQTANRLGELIGGSIDLAFLEALVDLVCVTKYTGTVCAEELVTAARRIIGARSFAGTEVLPIERLSLETPFGPLGPEVNAGIERRLGRRLLDGTLGMSKPLDGGDMNTGEGKKLSLAELQSHLDETARTLEEGLERNDLSAFYQFFRATRLPFAAPGFPHLCCRILHRLGGISPAMALAIENHLSSTSALATFPFRGEAQEARRRALLHQVNEQRLLVASAVSPLHTDKVATLGAVAQREENGFRINGTAVYVSLSTQSDILLFQAPLQGEGIGLFIVSLQNTPGFEIVPFHFHQSSDTRRITFQDVILPPDALLVEGTSEQALWLNRLEVIWHQMLITSLCLGAAARSLEEARTFLQSVRGKDDLRLAELDGMVVDMGRLAVRYRSAWAGVEQTAGRLGEMIRHPLDPAALEDLHELSSAVKYTGTLFAEEVITAVRRILRAWSFAGPIPRFMERLSLEMFFGPLGSDVNAVIERRQGRRALGEIPILTERLCSG